ncbi:MAG: phosphomannomutase/phosphoglucomutase, partial [Clostridiales bacterium]|nr:phosphomannomutase/phosphoglucomutase [Clostridiales bacterium]
LPLLERGKAISMEAEGQANRGRIQEEEYLSKYETFLADFIRKQLDTDVALPLLGLHVVVDAGNGAGGFYARLLETLGADVEGSQFLTPDGHFPNHPPNPENKEAMASLSKAVVHHEADLGVIFDADCDRAALVDSQGKSINRNRLIALVSAIVLDKEPGATIVTDSVTSTGLAEFIGGWGGEHYRYKRGYRNVIDEAILLNEAGINCPLAIETSGHAAFRENHFLDDGMYLATMLVAETMKLKQEGQNINILIEDLKEPVEETEIRLLIEEEDFQRYGRECIEQVLAFGEESENWAIAPDNREGVRYSFSFEEEGIEEGWFLLRLSVHDPVLPLNIESDIQGGINKLLQQLLVPLREAEGINIGPIVDYLENH